MLVTDYGALKVSLSLPGISFGSQNLDSKVPRDPTVLTDEAQRSIQSRYVPPSFSIVTYYGF